VSFPALHFRRDGGFARRGPGSAPQVPAATLARCHDSVSTRDASARRCATVRGASVPVVETAQDAGRFSRSSRISVAAAQEIAPIDALRRRPLRARERAAFGAFG
jgi:hypothetical protein